MWKYFSFFYIQRVKGYKVFITSTLCYHDWKTLTLFTYSSVLSMSHLSGRDYSNVFLYSLGRERENRYLFSLFSAVALTWQHIKNSKEEKTHGASDGVSAWGGKKTSGRNETFWMCFATMAARKVNLIWREKCLWSNSWMQSYNALWKHLLLFFFFFVKSRYPREKVYREGQGNGCNIKKKCSSNFVILKHFSRHRNSYCIALNTPTSRCASLFPSYCSIHGSRKVASDCISFPDGLGFFLFNNQFILAIHLFLGEKIGQTGSAIDCSHLANKYLSLATPLTSLILAPSVSYDWVWIRSAFMCRGSEEHRGRLRVLSSLVDSVQCRRPFRPHCVFFFFFLRLWISVLGSIIAVIMRPPHFNVEAGDIKTSRWHIVFRERSNDRVGGSRGCGWGGMLAVSAPPWNKRIPLMMTVLMHKFLLR